MSRHFALCTRALIAALALLSATSIGAQSSRPQAGSDRSQTRAAQPEARSPQPALPKGWTPRRTPWGDPDLHGTFANNDAYATPIERPDQFAGRRLEEITGAELAKVRSLQLQGVIDALPGGRVRGPDGWWVQNLNFGRGGQAWMVVDPPDGKIPALTPEAQQRARLAGRARSSFAGGPFDGPEDLGLLDRCISRSVPGSMIPVMYGNDYEIIQTPGFIVIRYEIIHETRIIPLDGRPHLGQAIRQHMGDARGHWEGDTLVVDTTNFTRAAAYRGANASTLRVVERFTRVSPDTIKWTATIDDPSTWTRPWTLGLPLFADPQGVMAFECHEGNYGMRNILSAERAGDRK
jgi:hypothetical protein